jgi:hypothetical protein
MFGPKLRAHPEKRYHRVKDALNSEGTTPTRTSGNLQDLITKSHSREIQEDCSSTNVTGPQCRMSITAKGALTWFVGTRSCGLADGPATLYGDRKSTGDNSCEEPRNQIAPERKVCKKVTWSDIGGISPVSVWCEAQECAQGKASKTGRRNEDRLDNLGRKPCNFAVNVSAPVKSKQTACVKCRLFIAHAW